eukprot:TRINITY_DN143556_c0_g1_i1.p1 TRINITY_DN143556_c0_g1~~TRINITY_DN143556_c0_g1_i1.p1  ORF type:complete len:459 (+),score=82.08 TRINITY_DN143556_c0_g1_i1:41-1417(+)
MDEKALRFIPRAIEIKPTNFEYKEPHDEFDHVNFIETETTRTPVDWLPFDVDTDINSEKQNFDAVADVAAKAGNKMLVSSGIPWKSIVAPISRETLETVVSEPNKSTDQKRNLSLLETDSCECIACRCNGKTEICMKEFQKGGIHADYVGCVSCVSTSKQSCLEQVEHSQPKVQLSPEDVLGTFALNQTLRKTTGKSYFGQISENRSEDSYKCPLREDISGFQGVSTLLQSLASFKEQYVRHNSTVDQREAIEKDINQSFDHDSRSQMFRFSHEDLVLPENGGVVFSRDLIGEKIEVLWKEEDDKTNWYPGTVTDWNPSNKKHYVLYDDGEKVWQHLQMFNKRKAREKIRICIRDSCKVENFDETRKRIEFEKKIKRANGMDYSGNNNNNRISISRTFNSQQSTLDKSLVSNSNNSAESNKTNEESVNIDKMTKTEWMKGRISIKHHIAQLMKQQQEN